LRIHVADRDVQRAQFTGATAYRSLERQAACRSIKTAKNFADIAVNFY
jgi:hypothetical protein